MKVLLKEADDGTLVLLEAEEINYLPKERVLNIWSSQSSFEIRNIEKANADYIVNDAFRCDKLDLDGLAPNSSFRPYTPHGVLILLESAYGSIFEGKHFTAIGRSKLVGKPMADMLLERNATVSVCHSKTSKDALKALLHQPDVVISAVSRPGILSQENLPTENPPIIVDVGTTMVDGKLQGDFRTDALAASGKLNNFDYTPVPGGVGQMTRATLMVHLVQAWIENQNAEPDIPEELMKKFRRLSNV